MYLLLIVVAARVRSQQNGRSGQMFGSHLCPLLRLKIAGRETGMKKREEEEEEEAATPPPVFLILNKHSSRETGEPLNARTANIIEPNAVIQYLNYKMNRRVAGEKQEVGGVPGLTD